MKEQYWMWFQRPGESYWVKWPYNSWSSLLAAKAQVERELADPENADRLFRIECPNGEFVYHPPVVPNTLDLENELAILKDLAKETPHVRG